MKKHDANLEKLAQFAKDNADATTTAADAAKRSATVAETALKLSERADAMLDRAEIDGPTGAGFNDSRWLQLTVKNCGRTKAENVVGDFKLIVNDEVRRSLTSKPTDPQ